MDRTVSNIAQIVATNTPDKAIFIIEGMVADAQDASKALSKQREHTLQEIARLQHEADRLERQSSAELQFAEKAKTVVCSVTTLLSEIVSATVEKEEFKFINCRGYGWNRDENIIEIIEGNGSVSISCIAAKLHETYQCVYYDVRSASNSLEGRGFVKPRQGYDCTVFDLSQQALANFWFWKWIQELQDRDQSLCGDHRPRSVLRLAARAAASIRMFQLHIFPRRISYREGDVPRIWSVIRRHGLVETLRRVALDIDGDSTLLYGHARRGYPTLEPTAIIREFSSLFPQDAVEASAELPSEPLVLAAADRATEPV